MRSARAWPTRCGIRPTTCVQRRRENALLKAQALPVQLVFPLVICFLPGIFLSTLAPVLYQMIQVAEGVLGAGQ